MGLTAIAGLILVRSWTVKIEKIIRIAINRSFFLLKIRAFLCYIKSKTIQIKAHC